MAPVCLRLTNGKACHNKLPKTTNFITLLCNMCLIIEQSKVAIFCLNIPEKRKCHIISVVLYYCITLIITINSCLSGPDVTVLIIGSG